MIPRDAIDLRLPMVDGLEVLERLVTAVLLILFGGAIATGVLTAASGIDLLVALTIVLIVRPLAGWIGLAGTDAGPRERQAIAFFGILFGFLGALIATPLAVALFVLVRKLYVEDVLERGEKREERGE